MKFKVGDKVTVREDIADITIDGVYNLWSGISDMAGREVVITGAYIGKFGPRYLIEGYARTFLEEFFEVPVECDGQINGFARPIDELGRVTIPIEFRRALGITASDHLDMCIINKVIHLVRGSGRKLDKLGRYTIPIEFRKSLGIVEGSLVDVHIDGYDLCIKKITLQCACCGSTEKKLYENREVLLCRDCVDDFFAEVAFNG